MYGRTDEFSGLLKRTFIPLGAIVTIDRMLKQEEASRGYQNTPRRVLALTSAATFEVVRTSGYVAALSLGIYYLTKL